jgi:hypothetical protein
MPEYTVKLRSPHAQQCLFLNSKAKRKIIKAGRRGGKTVGMAQQAVTAFLDGKRVLYAAPTSEQTDSFWFEVTRALQEALDNKVFNYDKGERFIELPGTKQRIKAKTAWNADTLRGDYADLLILDEYQLMNEDAWEVVGQPMLLDNNGDAVFIYTPPSLISAGVSKARDPRHASKLFKKALTDTAGLWGTFHFTSWDNPYISHEALEGIAKEMSQSAYRQEIMAEDDEIQSSWLVYNKFDERVCKIPRRAIPTSYLIYTGHDFGKANPAALFVAQDPATGFFYIFHEYAPGPRGADLHVKEWLKITQGYTVLRRVGGNQTTEDETRQLYSSHGWPITAPLRGEVNGQIERTRALFERNKIFIFDDMVGLLSQLSNCMWKLDDEGHTTNIIKDEAKYHYLACLRYLMSDFTPETAIKQSATTQVKYYTH